MTETIENTRPCTSCASPLAAGQDWCLECGSAQPGRLGSRAGWRAALTVMGATGFLALGAGAAAYAALSSDAQRAASAAAPPAAAPIVSAPPAQTAPPAPVETTPEVDAPDSDPADVPEVDAPDTDSADVPDDTSSDDLSGGSGGATGGDDASGDDASGDDDTKKDDEDTTTEPEKNGPGLQSIPLAAGAASTYDPRGRGGELVGDPADAIDGKPGTAWEVPVDAAGEVGIGLLVTLDQAKLIKKLKFSADTPGFEAEIYASAAKTPPATLSTPGWAKIGTRSDVGLESAITLGRRPYRHVLLWIVSQPADSKVAIPEVELLQ